MSKLKKKIGILLFLCLFVNCLSSIVFAGRVESYDFYNSNEAQPSLCSYTEDMDCRNTDIYIKEQIVKTIHSNDAANSFDEILHNTYHSSAGDTLLEIDDLFGCSIKITSANQILNTATGEDYIQFISEDRTELSFSKDGEIRKISTLHSPSLAIQSNNFTSQDLQQYCVNKMDKLYQLLNIEDSNAYVLSESYDFDDEYLFLTFEKMYENGVVNPLQSLNIVFNKNTLKFTIAVKFNSLPNAKEPIVSKAEAISVANSFSHGENVFSIAELTYIDDRTYNTNIHEYEDGICYLVYKITAPNVNTIIYVDALSGAYICRDIMMSETGFSVAIQESANSSAYNYNSDLSACSASEVRKFNSWRIDKMTWAASAMRRLGYVATSSSYADSTMNTDVRNYFKALSTEYAFYFTGHGDTSSIGFKRNHWITTDDVTGNWHFVFLDACSTAETTGWADAFKINGYTNRAYLGWNGKITWDNGYEFAEAFWPLINGQNTVRQAAVDAAALVPGAGTTPIKFYGDTSYTGVAWS